MDFIEKLLSSSGFNTILVIVNRLTKQVIFISAHNTITSMGLTCLFVLHVFSKHSVPSHITSNKDSKFMSNFFCSLSTALNMRLHFTSDYYPEGGGQTKCTNQTLKQYLHVYCNYQQDNWSELLSFTEFAYIMLRMLQLMFLHSSLIRDIIQTSLFTLNAILLPPKLLWPQTWLRLQLQAKTLVKRQK